MAPIPHDISADQARVHRVQDEDAVAGKPDIGVVFLCAPHLVDDVVSDRDVRNIIGGAGFKVRDEQAGTVGALNNVTVEHEVAAGRFNVDDIVLGATAEIDVPKRDVMRVIHQNNGTRGNRLHLHVLGRNCGGAGVDVDDGAGTGRDRLDVPLVGL